MAKRISLREFQEELMDRLLLAEQGGVSKALLGVQSGRDYWLVDLPDSGEVLPLPVLTSVPLTQPWFAGIANIRGTLFSVVDFSAFGGAESTARNADARLLLANARLGFNVALLVSRTLGLKPLDALEPTDGETAAAPPWVGASYRDLQGNIWRRLHFRQLLSNPHFLDIGR